MNNTPNLKMPNIEAAQAQKHVTHNEALRVLDAIVQLSVNDRDLATAPGTPVDGARYIVAASATGSWAGKDQQIAAWQDNAWSYYVPQEGWLAWVADEDKLLAWDGAAWNEISGSGGGSTTLNPANGGLVGINATADTTSRLSVSSPATLFNHAGNGHQIKVNKNAVADTASFLYQSGFSGRAEIGLTGDDDFHFKVSPDGTGWKDSIVIDKSTGVVTMPFTSSSAGGSHSVCEGRLTLTSGVAVSLSDVSAATTVYFTPFRGNKIGVYNGTAWSIFDLTEINLSLSGFAANTNFDIYVYDNSGTLTLENVAWTDDTTRATALILQDGVYVKSGEATRRYLGTIRTTGITGQTEDSAGGSITIAKRLVWNAYNRVSRPVLIYENTPSWAYSTSTWRRMNNNSNMKVDFVTGLSEDAIDFSGFFSMISTSTPVVGLAIDWTTGIPVDALYSFGAAGGAYGTVVIPMRRLVSAGYHTLSPLEKGNTGATFFGFFNGSWKCGVTGLIKG